MDLAIYGDTLRLSAGNPEEVANIIERGDPTELQQLAHSLSQQPLARERLVRVLRGGSLHKKGERKHNNHDNELFPCVAYWIGRGGDDAWQDSKDIDGEGDTVWHYALNDCPEGYGKATSLRKRWQTYINNPVKYKQEAVIQNLKLHKGDEKHLNEYLIEGRFWQGVRESISVMNDIEAYHFLLQQIEKSKKIRFPNLFLAFNSPPKPQRATARSLLEFR